MAEKKYMSLERLQEYDALIKNKIDEDVDALATQVAYINVEDNEDVADTEGGASGSGFKDVVIDAFESSTWSSVTFDGTTYENVGDINLSDDVFAKFREFVLSNAIRFVVNGGSTFDDVEYHETYYTFTYDVYDNSVYVKTCNYDYVIGDESVQENG